MQTHSITIGNFDGVHRGHQQLLKAALEMGSPMMVLTFYPHPARFLAPERAPVLLTDQAEKTRLLKDFGASRIETISFEDDVSNLTGQEFFSREILSRNPKALVVGSDFRFGQGRDSGVEELRQFCDAEGVPFKSIAPVLLDERPISSSWVRESLLNSDFTIAESLLGRPFELSGVVTGGKKLGRTLGFPTANLTLPAEREAKLPLPKGVYCGWALGQKPIVMNIGVNPSTDDIPVLKVEVHLIDFSGDLYGQELRVRPTHFIRGEKKFLNLEDLRKQIAEDVLDAKRKLGIE